jgi:hypothetical protein
LSLSYPGEPPVSELAAYAGVTTQAAYKWRDDQFYLHAVAREVQCNLWAADRALTERITTALLSRLDKQGQMPPVKVGSLSHLHVDAKRNWQGPTRCPACSEVFTDPDAYVHHIGADHPDVRYYVATKLK